MNTISQLDPILSDETKLFVNEILKITTPFSEKWILALHRASLEMSIKLNQLKREAAKTNHQTELPEKGLEPFYLETRPIIANLRTLFRKTFDVAPSCSNEEEFQTEWKDSISIFVFLS